jgi:hypothetical protein
LSVTVPCADDLDAFHAQGIHGRRLALLPSAGEQYHGQRSAESGTGQRGSPRLAFERLNAGLEI